MLSPSDHPVIAWYQRFTEAVQLMEQDASQAKAWLEELLRELRGAGSGVDELTGLVLGRLAECCYRLGDLIGTIEHSRVALDESRGDLERVLAHNSNLIALYARVGDDRECMRAIEYLIGLRETFSGAGHEDRLRTAFSDAAAELNNRAGEAPSEQSMRARALYETAIRLARLADADEQLAKVQYNFASLLMAIREDLGYAEQLIGIAACLVPRASHAGARALLFDATVRRKGLVADRMASERDAIRFAPDPRLASAMAEMRSVRDQIARILFDRTGARSGELVEWTGRKRDLERLLAECVPGSFRWICRTPRWSCCRPATPRLVSTGRGRGCTGYAALSR
jgi:tetratricopeptide (TPR) repeat protein